MASINEIQALVEQIKADLPLLVQRSQIAPRQIVVGTGLSDISERLGLVQAGEFRTGNGLEPGLGFSGVRIGYPAFVYENDTWNIVGVNNDVMQIGIRSSDGKLVAGGGNVIIDADGITVQNINAVSDAFMTFRGPGGELLGRIHTNVVGNLEIGAFGQSADNAERKLVLRSQIDDGLTNVATLEIIANSGDTGVDWITLNSDSVNIPGTTLIGGIATFDSGTDKRLEIGSDHYFPTRNSSNPNGFWNEANQDMDFTFEGNTAAIVLKIDAGLDAVGIGGAAESGYKLKVHGKVNLAAGNTYDINGSPHTHAPAITNYNPVATASAGSITTYSSSGKYVDFGGLVWYTATVTITNAGTAAGELRISIPFTANANSIGVGREDNATGVQLQAMINSGIAYARVVSYAGGGVIAAPRVYIISGWFTK
jgi:hypothetical protein